MDRDCKVHGLTRHYQRVDHGNSWKCNKCNRAAVRKSRNAKRDRVLALRGSKCQECGYDKCKDALHYHHLDPSHKDFQLDKDTLTKKSVEEIDREVEKCVLLCANCHAEVHAGVRVL